MSFLVVGVDVSFVGVGVSLVGVGVVCMSSCVGVPALMSSCNQQYKFGMTQSMKNTPTLATLLPVMPSY